MKKYLMITWLCFGVGALAIASDELGMHRKFSGVYRIYGGGLGDPVAPSPADSKVMFSIQGQAAKEIFDVIGPDKKDLCAEGSKIRVRHKDNEKLFCMKSAKGEYDCNFGFDLRSGKSIGGIIC